MSSLRELRRPPLKHPDKDIEFFKKWVESLFIALYYEQRRLEAKYVSELESLYQDGKFPPKEMLA